MQLTITIDCGNAAFGDGALEDARPEICRVLKKIEHYISARGISCPDEYPILDSNGNACGRVEFSR